MYLSVYKYVCLYLYASYAGIYVSVLVLCSSYYHLFMLLSCFVLCRSDLKRLNFWGFYTMVLERGDELISVATFRYYSDCFITKSFPMRFVCPIFSFGNFPQLLLTSFQWARDSESLETRLPKCHL